MRVASWNLKGRSGRAAASLGLLLRGRGGADLVLLQEASRRGMAKFIEAAGLRAGKGTRKVSQASATTGMQQISTRS